MSKRSAEEMNAEPNMAAISNAEIIAGNKRTIENLWREASGAKSLDSFYNDPQTRAKIRASLYIAARHGQVEQLLALNSMPSSLVLLRDEKNALHYAAENENEEMINFLLDNLHESTLEAMDVKDNRGLKPINYAARKDKDGNSYQRLMEEVAIANDRYWLDLLTSAIDTQDVEFVRPLLAASDGFWDHCESTSEALLHFAKKATDTEENKKIAECLFDELKMSIADVDKEGNTPLHYIAAAGRVEIAKIILENVAQAVKKCEDPETIEQLHKILTAKNAEGLTPLDLAKQNNRHEMVTLLSNHKTQALDSESLTSEDEETSESLTSEDEEADEKSAANPPSAVTTAHEAARLAMRRLEKAAGAAGRE
jgi:ankyrin repeat protein